MIHWVFMECVSTSSGIDERIWFKYSGGCSFLYYVP